MSDGMDYYTGLQTRLLEYIRDETMDSLYYRELAAEASDARAKELFLEFAKDEAEHAENFRAVYCRITGMEPGIGPVEPPKIPPYCEAVKQRIIAESGDFVKYGEEHVNAPDMELHKLFYVTGTIEARHGMRLATLLCGVE